MGKTCIAGGGCDKTHVFITLVTDPIPSATQFASYLLILRAASTLICVTLLDVNDAVLSAFR